jgi:radical SAM family uncharacterized protein/radical SAM-linked protein
MRYAPLAVDDLILSVQKPTRYVGGEFNAIHKSLPDASVTWALCFPDAYEVGMSNVGFRVLYHVLNQRPDVAAERTFMPWDDLEAKLRRQRVPLWTLESRAPVADFDILGFTLQTELCYATVLAVLDLAGLPLHSADRDHRHPLVIAGGPCAYSPEPISPFIDAFVVGEGEEVVHELADAVIDWKEGGGSRKELLWRLSEIPGVYVPALFEFRYRKDGPIDAIVPLKPGYEKITRRVVPDLNLVPQPTRPILPFMQTVHDRLPLEIQRGCTRSCRFCQVGMITRPTRQRDPHQVRALAESGLANTGYEQVGFLSLSAGDYEAINPMLEDFFERFEAEQIAISLPSLRTETMNDRLAAQIKRVRKTGFTMAPEAASERMRRVINKGNKEEDLLRAAESIFKAGWDLIKLYFMIGMPTERDEDVLAIADVARKVLRVGQRVAGGAGPSLHLGVSTFVPKPFTPFQWEPMLSLAETKRKHDLVRKALGKGRDIEFGYHDAKMSNVEGALTRGDRRVGLAILRAYQSGQRLDGWTEHFRFDRWQKAFAEVEQVHGVGQAFFGEREKGMDEVLPWDHIDCEVTKSFLKKERAGAVQESQVEDCAVHACTACGACDYDVVTTRTYREKDYVPAERLAPRPAPSTQRTHLRLRYAKQDRAVALSHLETMTALLRAFRRAKLPLAFSQGFHPKPKVGFGPACPVGVASAAEYVDLELVGSVEVEAARAAVLPQLPMGFALLEMTVLPPHAPSLSDSIEQQHFRLQLPGESTRESISARVAAFVAAPKLLITRADRPDAPAPSARDRDKQRPPRSIDVKAYVLRMELLPSGEVAFSLTSGHGGSARPSEVLAALFGTAGEVPAGARVFKDAVSFTPPPRFRVPSAPQMPRPGA